MNAALTFLVVLLFPLISGAQSNTVISKRYTPIIELTQTKILDNLHLVTRDGQKIQKQPKIFSPSLTHTAFFCKIEDRLGKSSRLPLKMRLGDVDYVDRMEGKSQVKIAPN